MQGKVRKREKLDAHQRSYNLTTREKKNIRKERGGRTDRKKKTHTLGRGTQKKQINLTKNAHVKNESTSKSTEKRTGGQERRGSGKNEPYSDEIKKMGGN